MSRAGPMNTMALLLLCCVSGSFFVVVLFSGWGLTPFPDPSGFILERITHAEKKFRRGVTTPGYSKPRFLVVALPPADTAVWSF